MIYHTTNSSFYSNNPFIYDLAYYFQDEIIFSFPIRLTIGVRYDFHQVKDLFNENQLSPKFGLVYHPASVTSLRFSAGKGFRSASIAEIFTNTLVSGYRVVPNLNLTAESAWSFEAGIHQIVGNNLTFDLVYFNNTYKNMIEPTLTVGFSPQTLQPQVLIHLDNLARTRIQGFEFSTTTSFLNRHLTFYLGYTFLDAKKLGNILTTFTLDRLPYTPSRALAYRPKHMIQTSIKGSYKRFLLGLDYRYISRFEEVLAYIDYPRIDQRVVDAYIEIDVIKNLKFLFRANNLLNYYYVEVEGNLAPIRNFTFTVNSSF